MIVSAVKQAMYREGNTLLVFRNRQEAHRHFSRWRHIGINLEMGQLKIRFGDCWVMFTSVDRPEVSTGLTAAKIFDHSVYQDAAARENIRNW